MLEKLLNLHCVGHCSRNPGTPLLCHQSVRWRRPRKPFWLGTAKSKKFVVKEYEDNKTPEEAAEHKLLTYRYNCQLKSLYKFIREDNPLIHQRLAAQAVDSSQQMEIEKQYKESMERNLEWNKVSENFRKERLKELNTKIEERVLEIIENVNKKKEALNKKVEKIIQNQTAASETFITPENLDEAIEKCLQNIVNHNYAIDLEGNKITGVGAPTPKVETITLDDRIS